MWSFWKTLLPRRLGKLLYVEEADIRGKSLELPEFDVCWMVGSAMPDNTPSVCEQVSWDAFFSGKSIPEEVADCALVRMKETRFIRLFEVLHRTKDTLKCGGTLYLDLDVNRPWISSRKIENALTEIGFSHIRSFGLLPPYRSSSIVLPVDSNRLRSEILRQLWLHKGKTFANKWRLAILQLLNQIGFLRFVWRHMLFVGRKEDEREKTDVGYPGHDIGSSLIETKRLTASENILDILSRKLDSNDLTVAVYPGHRKAIMPVYSQRAGTLGYVKFFWKRREITAGQNEVRLLRKLVHYEFEAGEVPEVLIEEGGVDIGQYIIMISTKHDLRNLNKFSTKHMNWLVELFTKTSALTTFEGSSYKSTVDAQLSQVLGYLGESESAWLEELVHGAVKELLDQNHIPLGMVQREFPYSHALKNGEKLFVIDWELGNERYPPYFDLYHLLLSLGGEIHRDPIENYMAKVDRLFFSKSGVRDIILDYSRRIGVPARLSYGFFLLYLLDQCSIHLTWDDVDRMAQQKLAVLRAFAKDQRFGPFNWLGGGI